jgi:hypothetical protein
MNTYGNAQMQSKRSANTKVVEIVLPSKERLAEPPTRETCSKSVWPEFDLVLFPDPLFAFVEGSGSSFEPKIIRGRTYSNTSSLTGLDVPPGRYRALVADCSRTTFCAGTLPTYVLTTVRYGARWQLSANR